MSKKKITKEEMEAEMTAPPLSVLMEEGGITRDRLVKKLNAELEAKETKFFQHQGKVVNSRTVIDWKTRQTARKDSFEYLGEKPSEKVEGTIVVVLDKS